MVIREGESKERRIRLAWILDYIGIPRSEEADKLATQTTISTSMVTTLPWLEGKYKSAVAGGLRQAL